MTGVQTCALPIWDDVNGLESGGFADLIEVGGDIGGDDGGGGDDGRGHCEAGGGARAVAAADGGQRETQHAGAKNQQGFAESHSKIVKHLKWGFPPQAFFVEYLLNIRAERQELLPQMKIRWTQIIRVEPLGISSVCI